MCVCFVCVWFVCVLVCLFVCVCVALCCYEKDLLLSCVRVCVVVCFACRFSGLCLCGFMFMVAVQCVHLLDVCQCLCSALFFL